MVKMKIIVPNEFTGDILSDLNTKRAPCTAWTPRATWTKLSRSHHGRGAALRHRPESITQGRGTYTMEFSHYQEVPAHTTQKIIAERQAEREAEANLNK